MNLSEELLLVISLFLHLIILILMIIEIEKCGLGCSLPLFKGVILFFVDCFLVLIN